MAAMTYEDARTLESCWSKLSVLLTKTTDANEQVRINAELDRISPHLNEAATVVLNATGENFAKVAQQVKAKIKPIDDAIADIKKIDTALTTAAQIVNAIVGALGAVGGLGLGI